MAFTYPTITHNFGSSSSGGVVEWSLLTPMTNGTVTVLPPNIVSSTLDASGNLSENTVPSNLDASTEPSYPWAATYRLDIQVTGAQAQSYVIQVPPIQTETAGSIVSGALNTVQLSLLSAAEYMIGQSVACAGHVPAGAVVTGVNTSNNTITMSTAGTAGTSLSVTLGTDIDLGYLLPTVPQPL